MEKSKMILEYLSTLAEIHNKKLSEMITTVYLNIFEKYEYKQLESAFDSLLKTAKFFPKPVEIIEAIVGGKEDRSLTAWSKVISAVKKYGSYTSIDFSDPLIVRAITLIGGWSLICGTNSSEMVWTQKEFERIYKNLIASRFSGKDTVVIGHIEASNRLNNYLDSIPATIKIGHEAKQIES